MYSTSVVAYSTPCSILKESDTTDENSTFFIGFAIDSIKELPPLMCENKLKKKLMKSITWSNLRIVSRNTQGFFNPLLQAREKRVHSRVSEKKK